MVRAWGESKIKRASAGMRGKAAMIELALGRDRATASRGTDARRVLQLVLAATWLLDGLLQYQSFMYTKAFGQMLGGTAAGNPGIIARPISWNAALVEDHLVLLNTVFATIQLLMGLGIGSLAYFALTSANRAPQALHDIIVSVSGGEPGWATGLEKHAAAVLAHQGLTASIVLAVALIAIAVGMFLPPPLARSALILAGGATDPNSAPLLALLALAYWPPATAGPRARRPQADGPPAMAVGRPEEKSA
jgi:hypothetical protein